MLALFTRRKDTPNPDTVPETTAEQPTAEPTDDNLLIRFLTVGGAVVEVRRTRFVTRWVGGPPFAASEPYEIGGYQWTCAGCGAYGREGETYQDRNYRQEKEAREEGNAHADQCRALPKPTTA